MDINKYIEEFSYNDYTHFKEFYEATSKGIYLTAYSILHDSSLSDDIIQDTYIAFLNNIEKYKLGTNIGAYLTTIARNKSLNLYNKNKREVVDSEFLSYLPDENGSSNYDMSGVDAILDHLSDSEAKEIIVYHVILDYKFKDIAKILNKPLGTILWRYNKSMKELKEAIGNEE